MMLEKHAVRPPLRPLAPPPDETQPPQPGPSYSTLPFNPRSTVYRTINAVLITPPMAVEILNLNYDNRTLRPAVIAFLVRQIKAGRWKLNGETIKFDADGRLIDGQHRLWACIESGIPILLDVTVGVAANAYKTIGIGAKKSVSDFLKADKEKSCHLLGGALSWLSRIQNETVLASVARLSGDEASELLAENPDLRVSVARKYRNITSGSLSAALHYLFAKRDKALADLFFDRLEDGVGLSETDPIYRLRERLIANQNRSAKLPLEEVAALAVKAWNLRRQGRQSWGLRWKREDGFPEIK